VIELRGNLNYAHCLDCARRYEIAELRSAFERNGTAPVCGACGGWVKTATISFGQAMPVAAMRRAEMTALGEILPSTALLRVSPVFFTNRARFPRRASIFCYPPHAARFFPYASRRQMQ
jgi:Sir2 family